MRPRLLPTDIINVDRNAWRADAAGKLGFIIDAADYYRALKDVLPNARKSIWIIESRRLALTEFQPAQLMNENKE